VRTGVAMVCPTGWAILVENEGGAARPSEKWRSTYFRRDWGRKSRLWH